MHFDIRFKRKTNKNTLYHEYQKLNLHSLIEKRQLISGKIFFYLSNIFKLRIMWRRSGPAIISVYVYFVSCLHRLNFFYHFHLFWIMILPQNLGITDWLQNIFHRANLKEIYE